MLGTTLWGLRNRCRWVANGSRRTCVEPLNTNSVPRTLGEIRASRHFGVSANFRTSRLLVRCEGQSLAIATNSGLVLVRPQETQKMAPKAPKQQQQAAVSLGPNVADGENVFGVAHIFAS